MRNPTCDPALDDGPIRTSTGLLSGLFGVDVPKQARRHAGCDVLVGD
jgi:hypothetical protein